MTTFTKYVCVLAMFTAVSCNNPTEKKETNSAVVANSIVEKPYGSFNKEPVVEYTLTNKNGMQVSIINYGGTVTKMITKDKFGNDGDVLLGYDSLAGYLQTGNPYFGCLIGRFGNRIANGSFQLDGTTYQLAKNNNGQSLHGGIKGYDKVMWKATKLAGDSSLQLNYLSYDGEEGYPGNLNIKVLYTLTANDALKIDYTATTDKATPINLTNHCYFNLSAGKDSTIENHELMMAADQYTEVNEVLIPTGALPTVKGTPMDFTSAKAIGKDLNAVKGGYDHNWVLRKKGNALENVASLYHPASGRLMEVFTTEPGLQFYSGNFLDGTLKHTKAGQQYVLHAGLCLETQHFPDAPNQPSFPNTILKQGETYTQTALYQFSVRK